MSHCVSEHVYVILEVFLLSFVIHGISSNYRLFVAINRSIQIRK